MVDFYQDSHSLVNSATYFFITTLFTIQILLYFMEVANVPNFSMVYDDSTIYTTHYLIVDYQRRRKDFLIGGHSM